MDRVIENKRWIKKKYIPYLAGGALALILVIWLIFGNHLSTLKVDKRLLTIEPAQQGQFNDYVRVNGQVQRSRPFNSVRSRAAWWKKSSSKRELWYIRAR